MHARAFSELGSAVSAVCRLRVCFNIFNCLRFSFFVHFFFGVYVRYRVSFVLVKNPDDPLLVSSVQESLHMVVT